MSEEALPQRRRALRPEVAAKRAGQKAAEPLIAKVNLWRQASLRLGARLEHARIKGQPTAPIVEEAEALAAAISDALDKWRLEAPEDASGRVADAERAAGAIFGLLQSFQRRR